MDGYTGRAARHLLIFLVVIGLLAALRPANRSLTAAEPAPNPQADYIVRPRSMPHIPPGTVVGTRAPQNWTHLIIKSQPRVAEGDVEEVAERTLTLARLLSVSTLANVKQIDVGGRPQYYLDRVALGMGTRIRDQDVIISSDTQAELGANLGLLARTVLSGTEAEMEAIKAVLRSRTMVVFDAPTVVVYQQQHRAMIVRQAVLVDAASGQLSTLVWLIDKNDAGQYTQAISPMNLLAPNTIEDRHLSVDASQFTVGIPSSTALALVRIPPGTPIDIPPALLTLAGTQVFTVETARELELGLQALVRGAASSRPTERERVRTTPAATTPARPARPR